MSCKHPLKAFPIGLTENGKTKYKICSYDVHHVELTSCDKWIATKSDYFLPSAKRVVTDFIEIPCGQCEACRMQYARQWANRCMLELQDHDSAFFVTLTYNNDMVPMSQYVDEETGEVFDSLTLRKRDLQLFFKRLRKHFPDDHIRYYACGEYGGKTYRPHYHAIIYGLHLNDLVFYKKNELGQNYYTSQSLSDVWRKEVGKKEYKYYGHVIVGEVTWESCSYTARYVMKKLKGKEAEFYGKFNVEPEFTVCSRRPGIARNYFDLHPDIYSKSYISIPTEKGGLKVYPPRYFDKLYDLENPEEMEMIKKNRLKVAQAATAAKLKNTSLSYLEMLEVEERNEKAKHKSLKREL